MSGPNCHDPSCPVPDEIAVGHVLAGLRLVDPARWIETFAAAARIRHAELSGVPDGEPCPDEQHADVRAAAVAGAMIGAGVRS